MTKTLKQLISWNNKQERKRDQINHDYLNLGSGNAETSPANSL